MIRTDYDPSRPENKQQHAHIHDREKNRVWTQEERARASRADTPTSIRGLEDKVLHDTA